MTLPEAESVIVTVNGQFCVLKAGEINGAGGVAGGGPGGHPVNAKSATTERSLRANGNVRMVHTPEAVP